MGVDAMDIRFMEAKESDTTCQQHKKKTQDMADTTPQAIGSSGSQSSKTEYKPPPFFIHNVVMITILSYHTNCGDSTRRPRGAASTSSNMSSNKN